MLIKKEKKSRIVAEWLQQADHLHMQQVTSSIPVSWPFYCDVVVAPQRSINASQKNIFKKKKVILKVTLYNIFLHFRPIPEVES